MHTTDPKRILVVDDDLGDRILLKKILGKNYIVTEVSNGKEALDYLARSEKPALILMDIMMPQMDGYTACSRIKADQATKGIPLVMLTGVDHELNKKFAEEMGADGYITKTFINQDLPDLISKFLESPK